MEALNKDLFKTFTEEVKGITDSALRADVSEQINVIADVLGSLTKGRLGGGHSKAYYKRKNRYYAEIFAHGASLRYVENPIFKKYLPELHDDIVNLVKKYYEN